MSEGKIAPVISGSLAFTDKIDRFDMVIEPLGKQIERVEPAALDAVVEYLVYMYYMGSRQFAEMDFPNPEAMVRLRMKLDALKELGLEISATILSIRQARAKGIQPGRSEEA